MRYALTLVFLCSLLFGSFFIVSVSGDMLTVDILFDRVWRIATIDEYGSDPTFLTDISSDNFGAVWSPDGKQIAFISDRDKIYKVYIMDANGENPHQITIINNIWEYSVSWSPDGKKLAITRGVGNNPSVYIIDADGQNETLLAENADGADWSPGGKHIALWKAKGDMGRGIYVMDINSGECKFLIPVAGLPKWSPDGRRIAYSNNGQIWVMDVESQDSVQLTNNANNANLWLFGPCWSPDGKKIACYSSNPWQRTWIIRTNSQSKRLLDYKYPNRPTSWVPVQPRAVDPSSKLAAAWGRLKRDS